MAMQSNSVTHLMDQNDDAARWRAVLRRSPSSHSAFFYGVKSTMIYCRPTCNARIARRSNVIFYDTAEQACRDGYRPCKRCRPDDKSFTGHGEELTTKVLALLRDKGDDVIVQRRIKTLAKELGITSSYLCRVFKKTMGVTIGNYVKNFETNNTELSFESSTNNEPMNLNVNSQTFNINSIINSDLNSVNSNTDSNMKPAIIDESLSIDDLISEDCFL